MDSKLFFPYTNVINDDFQPLVPQAKNMLDRGIDPKPMLMELCEPMCVFWKDKLKRCEKKLEKIIKINPTKSCMYPMRDYVTCVEACVKFIYIIMYTGTTKNIQ
jgi:ubiquinol-cytochrome c reductase subunit 6